MNKPEIKEIKIDRFYCESCGERIIQDGKDVQFIYDDNGKILYHFHRTCLIKHLSKTFISNP